jgi:hypothetical protein
MTGSSRHMLRGPYNRSRSELTGGTPVRVVATQLGDDSGGVFRSYAHLVPTLEQRAANVVAEPLMEVG